MKHLFKDADEEQAEVRCFYRRVLCEGIDHPETAEFTEIPLSTKMDDLYEKERKEHGEFTKPQEGLQLMKVIGNVDPKEKNKHSCQAKRLYDNKDKDGNTAGTSVQCVKVNKTNKDGKKEPIQYIKAVKGENLAPGEGNRDQQEY